ncbi:hypothetical protein J7E90_33070 [Streptomyces sp. ISL-111]|uniref:hypothetical protein n=1 Tax=Streptomyces sp. ISL-111 TaxID=2819175 RepID=UPI001BE72BE1|nr:hypothetical protein [Streptomyces sp. ISL-111]MBT2381977.1 hypothetical protein [Streptomyces sp. ISL-111]
MIPFAALAVVRAAVEDSQRGHDQAEAAVARIVIELRDQGWTLAPLDQAEQPAA